MNQKIKLQGLNDELDVTVIGKNVAITEPIKEYIYGKIKKIEKVNHLIIDLVVRLDVQKMDHCVDIVMKFSHFKVNVHAITHDMYASIDKAFDKLKAKLLRWKERIQDHHAKKVSVIDLEVEVLEKDSSGLEEINDEIEEQNLREIEKTLKLPIVYKKKTRVLKVLNLEEAVMKMELSADNFLVYKSEEDRQLKVLYRRKDDSYGIISIAQESQGA